MFVNFIRKGVFNMGFALASLTKRPVLTSCLEYGNDDSQLGRSGMLGTIATWSIESKEDCYKAYFVFFIKKLFYFLDWIGMGQYVFGSRGFSGELNRCIIYQTGLERNAQSREKIIDALGGREDCAKIRTISYDASYAADFDNSSKYNFDVAKLQGLQASLKLGEQAFYSREGVLQGEDMAGRKLVAMRLIDVKGVVYIATAHQPLRETCINDELADGRHWILNFFVDWRYWILNIHACDYTSYNIGLGKDSTDKVAEFIKKVVNGQHEKFSIAPKP